MGAITGNALGLGGQYGDVLSKITTDTIGGLVSVGASIGLDAIGAPPILQGFVPGILGQLASGIASGNGGGGPPQTQGESIFSKIKDGVVKFGKGIVNVASNVIDFGQKVFEGGISLAREGLSNAAEAFSNLFNRKTVEVLSDGGEVSLKNRILTSGNFVQNDDIFNWEVELGGETYGISHLGNGEYIVQEGNVTKTFTDLITDDFGNFGANITIAENLGDGLFSTQYYDSLGLQRVEMSEFDQLLLEISPYDEFTRLDLNDSTLTGQFKSEQLGFDYRINSGAIEDYFFDPFAAFGVETESVTPKFDLMNLTSPEELVFNMFHDAVENEPGSEILAGTIDAAKNEILDRFSDANKATQILDLIDAQGVVPRIELVTGTQEQVLLEAGSFRVTRETSQSAFYGNLESNVTIKVNLNTGAIEGFSVEGKVPFSTLSGPVIDGTVLSDAYVNLTDHPLLNTPEVVFGLSTGTGNFSNSVAASRDLLSGMLSMEFENTIGIGGQDAHSNTIRIEGNQADLLSATVLIGSGVVALNAFGALRLVPVLQRVIPGILAAFALEDENQG